MVHELGTVPVWSVVELQGKVWAAVGAAIVRFDAQTYAKIDELKGHTKPITCLLVVGDEVYIPLLVHEPSCESMCSKLVGRYGVAAKITQFECGAALTVR